MIPSVAPVQDLLPHPPVLRLPDRRHHRALRLRRRLCTVPVVHGVLTATASWRRHARQRWPPRPRSCS
ncbi:hypothetical protein LT493_16695 [Streptomyces tricolor]|nr:hypothetical protein [Streptomyces tricolor]